MTVSRYHNILGVAPAASLEEIKRAFKELAFQYHPDRNPHNPLAEERFREIAEAYASLTQNPELLRVVQSSQKIRVQDDPVFTDIFDQIFETNLQAFAPPGKDLYETLELSLEEAFAGSVQKFKVTREKPCEDCQGKGSRSGKSFTCTYCFGRGKVTIQVHGVSSEKSCPKCRGLGRIPQDPCPSCRGRGVTAFFEKITLKLPPKVTHGQILRYPGLGSMHARGQNPGDLIVQIALKPHARFTFDALDVLCELPLTFSQAKQGGNFQVPTLAGPRTLQIPPLCRSGHLFRLPQMGLGGDQIIIVRVLEDHTSAHPLLMAPKEKKQTLSPLKRLLKKITTPRSGSDL